MVVINEDVTVDVFALSQTEPKKFTWKLTKLVGEAAKEAAKEFGYEGGYPTLGHRENIFKRDETLEAAHVHDGENLALLVVGGVV